MECFWSDVRSQIESNKFAANSRRIVCQQCTYEKKILPYLPYDDDLVVQLVSRDKDTLAVYMSGHANAERLETESKVRAREMALEKKIEEVRLEGELKLHAHNEVERLKAVANLHRYRIIDAILTARCPNCSLVFLEWTSCFAVKCEIDISKTESLGCRNYFCGWCFESFKDGCVCHDHVYACKKSRNPRQHYCKDPPGMLVEFNAAQVPVRKRKIEEYLADAKNGLTAAERQAVVTLMQKTDLDALGIKM